MKNLIQSKFLDMSVMLQSLLFTEKNAQNGEDRLFNHAFRSLTVSLAHA